MSATASSTRSGAGRVLVAVYGVFALAATARSLVQLLTKADEAPLAYSLSARPPRCMSSRWSPCPAPGAGPGG